MKLSSKDIGEFVKKNCYVLIVIVVALLGLIVSFVVTHTLNNAEKEAYNLIEGIKNEFKDPKSINIVSIKLCDKDYAIAKISGTNSFSGTVTDNYYIYKKTLNFGDNKRARGIVDKCFELEKNNYDSVKVLSSSSIDKINSKIKRSN